MTAHALLDCCPRVRRTGPDRWLACCPAHEDHHASLAIRELDNGLVLVHCFAGCGALEIVRAVGLTFEALFPERPMAGPGVIRERHPFPALDVLRATASESLIVATMAARLGAGHAPTGQDRARALLAAERLLAALALLEDADGRGMSRSRRHQYADAARAANQIEETAAAAREGA